MALTTQPARTSHGAHGLGRAVDEAPRGSAGGRVRRAVGTTLSVLVTAAVVALAVYLWPTAWGGATSLVVVSGHSMDGTYATGDLLVARTGEAHVGDVVVYAPHELDGAHIVHRIVGGDAETGWVLQGDNNTWQDPFHPTADEVVGVVHHHIGGVSVVTDLLTAPTAWIGVILVALGLLLWPSRVRGVPDEPSAADAEMLDSEKVEPGTDEP